jgi:hypothetical protein
VQTWRELGRFPGDVTLPCDGAVQLPLGESLSFAVVCAAEIGAVEVDVGETGVVEAGVAEVGVAQVFREESAAEIGAL